MASLGSLVVRQGPDTLAQQFKSHKRRLDQIAGGLKSIRDNISDRGQDLDGRVRNAKAEGQMVGLGAGVFAGVFLGPLAGAGIGGAVGILLGNHNADEIYENDRRCDREDRGQMRELLGEFQEKIKTMRLTLKFIRRFFSEHHMDTRKLQQMETLINELINEISEASSLQSLKRVSSQCQRVLTQLEDTLEDVQVECYFMSSSKQLQF